MIITDHIPDVVTKPLLKYSYGDMVLAVRRSAFQGWPGALPLFTLLQNVLLHLRV
jgi:hypothetical protein